MTYGIPRMTSRWVPIMYPKREVQLAYRVHRNIPGALAVQLMQEALAVQLMPYTAAVLVMIFIDH